MHFTKVYTFVAMTLLFCFSEVKYLYQPIKVKLNEGKLEVLIFQ
jgi:hypothetical protein